MRTLTILKTLIFAEGSEDLEDEDFDDFEGRGVAGNLEDEDFDDFEDTDFAEDSEDLEDEDFDDFEDTDLKLKILKI